MYYLKNLHFKVPYTGEEISFDDGEVPGYYEILNWQRASDGGVAFASIGYYNSTMLAEEKLFIDNSSIIWYNDMLQVGELHKQRSATQTPESHCCITSREKNTDW